MRILVVVAVFGLCTIGHHRWTLAEDGETSGQSDIAERVDTHLRRGIEFYAEKQFELAIVEFRAGYAIDPRPDFLFALAQAERLSGDCPTAIVYYRRFLDTQPTANQAEAARVNMRRCERALESGPSGPPEQPTRTALDHAEQAAAPEPPPVPDVAPAPNLAGRTDVGPEPWYRDAVGASLAAGGLVGLGLGAGFWVAKGSAEADAARAEDYDTYVQSLDRARRNRTLAVAGLTVGTALAGAAIYRYLTHSRQQRRGGAALVVGPTSSGGFAGLAGRF